jgi:5-dehydro-4-deoxyglucarate dehydratase
MIFNVLLPLNKIHKSKNGYAVSLIKTGVEIMELGVANTVRPPVVPLSKENNKELEGAIKAVLERYPIESKEVSRQ